MNLYVPYLLQLKVIVFMLQLGMKNTLFPSSCSNFLDTSGQPADFL